MSRTTRRGLLLLGAGTAIAGGLHLSRNGVGGLSQALGGGSVPVTEVGDVSTTDDGSGGCRSPETLVQFGSIMGARLGYEISRSRTTMRSDPSFLDLLEAWAGDWTELSGLGAIKQVWSYGAFTDKCGSFHQSGRAFDFAEVVHSRGSVSCRFDKWGPGDATQLRNYWRLAASLHLHFSHTLTHLYNRQHVNHIHVDNAISGQGPTRFNPSSRVQVQMVQAVCRHVHGVEVGFTGSWDEQTREAVRQVQKSSGITRPMAELDGWQAFLRASASA